MLTGHSLRNLRATQADTPAQRKHTRASARIHAHAHTPSCAGKGEQINTNARARALTCTWSHAHASLHLVVVHKHAFSSFRVPCALITEQAPKGPTLRRIVDQICEYFQIRYVSWHTCRNLGLGKSFARECGAWHHVHADEREVSEVVFGISSLFRSVDFLTSYPSPISDQTMLIVTSCQRHCRRHLL
eukprot:6198386-Pleurochrysis_carterae.AAC.1